MSDAFEEDELLEELAPAPIYIAEETPERRRQWCVDMGCYYFGGPAREGALTHISTAFAVGRAKAR